MPKDTQDQNTFDVTAGTPLDVLVMPKPPEDDRLIAAQSLGLLAMLQQTSIELIKPIVKVPAKAETPSIAPVDIAKAEQAITAIAEQPLTLRKRLDADPATKDKLNTVYLGTRLLQYSLDGVKDEKLRTQLVAMLHYSYFGIPAVEMFTKTFSEADQKYPRAELGKRLSQVDNDNAPEILEAFAKMKSSYDQLVKQTK